MGASKQKWTTAEEAALRAGVKKYGLGKWRAIQKDPEFTFLLATRSNVDLKDKWRNMNIGDGGYLSRERSLRSPAKHKAPKRASEPISPLPLAMIPHEYTAEEVRGSSDSPKSLEARCTSMVIDAIMDLNDPNGASISEIATCIEANHLVPANFRKLLKLKLKEMVKQGGLIKDKDNYKVMDPEESDDDKQMVQVTRKRTRRIVKAKAVEPSIHGRRHIQQEDCGISDLTLRPSFKLHGKKTRGERGMEKAMLDVDYARSKLKSAAEAAKAAALAMAEAEAAATAAGKAAKRARAPDAEAEAAEIAAEVAALSSRPHKKGALIVY